MNGTSGKGIPFSAEAAGVVIAPASTSPFGETRFMSVRVSKRIGRAVGALLTLLILFGALVMATGWNSPTAFSLAAAQAPPAGPVIVVLQPNTNAAQLAALAQARPNFVYSNVFSGFSATLTAGAIEVLLRNPRVLSITEDVPVQAAA